MGKYIYVDLSGPLADEFRAYESLIDDLEEVREYIDRIRELSEPKGGEEVGPATEHRALWIAAVMTYARCFSAGARKAFADRAVIPKRYATTHKWMLAYRNNTIGHMSREPVGHEVIVTLHVWDDGDDFYSTTVSAGTIYLLSNASERFIALTRSLQGQYQKFSDEAYWRIREAADSVPPDRLRAAAKRKQVFLLRD